MIVMYLLDVPETHFNFLLNEMFIASAKRSSLMANRNNSKRRAVKRVDQPSLTNLYYSALYRRLKLLVACWIYQVNNHKLLLLYPLQLQSNMQAYAIRIRHTIYEYITKFTPCHCQLLCQQIQDINRFHRISLLISQFYFTTGYFSLFSSVELTAFTMCAPHPRKEFVRNSDQQIIFAAPTAFADSQMVQTHLRFA